MKRLDKWVLYVFFGLLAGYAGILLVYGIFVRREPLEKFEQRRLATHLRFAYQKYRSAQGVWPNTPEDAAKEYAEEAPELPTFLSRAHEKWGVSVAIVPGGTETLRVSYDRPQRNVIELEMQGRGTQKQENP